MILKTKLSLGLGFLFLIILILLGFCSYYVDKLGQEADNILKDNYSSIVYAKNMLAGLDDMRTSVSSSMTGRAMSDYNLKLFESGRSLFEANLKAENNNITEMHEKEYVAKLNREYEVYLKLCLQMKDRFRGTSMYVKAFLPANERVKQAINSIYEVNMQAVVRKTELTKHDAGRFVNFMAIIGSLCMLLAGAYFWYFPVYISTTLSYLAERMRSVVKSAGITFDVKTNDEAHIILNGINLLESKMGTKKGSAAPPHA